MSTSGNKTSGEIKGKVIILYMTNIKKHKLPTDEVNLISGWRPLVSRKSSLH